VNLLGITPCHICWKSCITVSSCPSFACFISFRLHADTLNCTIPGAFAAISAATHGEFRQSSTQSASHVFLCLKSGTFHLSTTRNPDQADQPYSPHPGNKGYHKNRERCTDLLHQHTALTYLLQPTTTPPPVQRTWKEILHSLDQGWIAKTNREKKDWRQQEVWFHWHVNSDRFDVQLPSLIYDPNIATYP